MVDEKKSRRVQQRTLDTKAAIQKAALQEFANVGFDGASTRSIAELAGGKHTLIAHHFGSKDALWKSTAEHLFGLYTERLNNRRIGLEGVDESTLLRLLLKEFILFSAEYPEFHRFMIQASQGDEGRLKWLVDTFIQPESGNEMLLLAAAQKAGVFIHGDPVHLRYIFLGAATSIFTLASECKLISGVDAFDETVIDTHVDLVLRIFCDNQTAASKAES